SVSNNVTLHGPRRAADQSEGQVMPVPSSLKARLASGPSMEGLAPIVAVGAMGIRVAAAAETLRADLAEPVAPAAGRGDLGGMRLRGAADVTAAVGTLLRANRSQTDVVVDMFGRDPEPAVLGFQDAFLETTFTATLLLAAGGELTSDRIDDLIRVGASVSAA